MSFLNALNAAGWTLLLAIPPLIVALYFLKLKRKPVEVPSTYLWSRTIEDLHVNSIWQRLRRSLLLFLQLLFVLLMILACLRPGWQGTELQGNRFILMIDTSASMGASDVQGSRLDEAKRLASQMLNQKRADDMAMLISFSDRSIIEQSYTNNLRLLQNKLMAIKQTQRRTNMDEALRAAGGLANPGRSSNSEPPNSDTVSQDIAAAEAVPAELMIFTDGGIGTIPEFALGNLRAKYIPVGTDSNVRNVSVVTFSIGDNPERPGQVQGFARIENCGRADETINLSLFLNGQIWDAREGVVVPASNGINLTFDLLDGQRVREVDAGILELVLEIDDDLPLDNEAFAVLNSPRKSKVLLVTDGNDALELVLSTAHVQSTAEVSISNESLLSSKDFRTLADTGAYDLIIFDRCSPEVMPQSNSLFIGSLPPDDKWTAGPSRFPIGIIDFHRTHPLMNFVQLSEVIVVDARNVSGPSGTVSLVDANIGSIMAIGPREGFEDLVIGFPLIGTNASGESEQNTDWPKHLSFPTFFQNVLTYLGGYGAIPLAASVHPGEQKLIRPRNLVDRVRVEMPDGRREVLERPVDNSFVFTDTERVGIYDVLEGEARDVDQRFAVNLLDEQESDLNVPDTIDIGYEELQAQTARVKTRIEGWRWLLGIALVLLALEWYIYNRRVYL